MDPSADPLPELIAALRARHLARAAIPDLRKGIQSLSTLYVEKRDRNRPGAPFEGEGRRAAFALFYGTLHFITVRRIVAEVGAAVPPPRRILDLGCGTGAAGAAWALAAGGAEVEGVEANPWAIEEARWLLRTLGLPGRIRRGDAARARPPGPGEAAVAAYAINELPPAARDSLLEVLLAAAGEGARILVIEPIARAITPWWDGWAARFAAVGGRSDDWRFPGAMPEELEEFDRAAGLDHRELTARSLFIGDSL